MQKALNADIRRVSPLKKVRKKVNFFPDIQVGLIFSPYHSEGFLP